MAKFIIDGIKLRVPGTALSEELEQELSSGNYEWNEAIAVNRHVEAGDRVLDIGAGAGFISILAAKRAGGDNVVSVEANAGMLQALRQNLDQNGAEAAQLVHGAVVPDAFEDDHVLFDRSEAFWAGSIAGTDTPPDQIDEVPAIRFSDLLAEHRPTIICLDVEGGEVELCQQQWPDHIRLVVMEIHTKKYPPSSVKQIVDGMSANNFTLMPWGTRGEVIVWQRVTA